MQEESAQLFFDADYTTRAIALGIKPTREYITVGELVENNQIIDKIFSPSDGLSGNIEL